MSEPFSAEKEPGEPGSIEWLMERVGKCTGSRFDDVIAKQKTGKPSASRETYLYELVMERLCQKPSEHYFSNAMQHGIENEPFARMAYEATHGMVSVPGFQPHPTIAMCGVSSDGLIGDDGTIEIKCPYNSKNHLVTLLKGMPSEHMAQCQGGLWVWGRQYCDFISYDPTMPAHLQLYVQRIPRDQAYIDAMEAEIVVFLKEVDALVKKLDSAL